MTLDRRTHIARILRKTSQLLFLSLFFYLISRNRYPLEFPLPTDFFLRIDPLSALSVMVAGRELALRFWPAVVTLFSVFILGRFFCGWVCPLGTTLDLSDRIVKPPRRERKVKQWHYLKYMILTIVFIGAVFSFQFIFFFDPLVIITRTTTLTILPIIYHLGENLLASLALTPHIGDLFYNLYSGLKGALLPVQEQAFRQGLPVLLIFLIIVLLEKITKRFWCRYLCPLGALLGVCGKFSAFGRSVGA